MKAWMWCVAATAVLAGCQLPGTLDQKTCERMFLPLMSDAQKAEYYNIGKRPTWAERKAYLYEIGMMPKFEEAPDEVRSAILHQRVILGMTPEQVTMSWGPPDRIEEAPVSADPEVARREGRKKIWLYGRAFSPADLAYLYRRGVEFVNDVVLNVYEQPAKS